MSKINKQQGREFLEGISSEDRILIFTHDDLDGFASGILYLDFCKQKKCSKVDFHILDYGANKISDFDVSDYNVILISDLAPSIISPDLHLLKAKKVLYVDHHKEDIAFPVADFVSELRTLNEGYVPATRTVYELTEKENKKKLWLAILGVLSDSGERYKENLPFLERSYLLSNKKQEEFFEYLFNLNFALIGAPSLEIIFEKVSEIKKVEEIVKLSEYYLPVAKEFSRLEKDFEKNKEVFNGIVYYHFDSFYPPLKSPLINKLSSTDFHRVFVFTNPRGDLTSLSARNQSQEYDVSKVLQDCVVGLKNGSAGGHKFAAGGNIGIDELDQFKQNLNSYNVENARVKHG